MKQTYTIIAFRSDKPLYSPAKYRQVRNLDRFYKFAQKSGFLYYNIYHDKTAGPGKDRSFKERIWVI